MLSRSFCKVNFPSSIQNSSGPVLRASGRPEANDRFRSRYPPPVTARSPLHTPLCELLGIRHPLLLAPMAGGWSTPELVAAVTRSGGLGMFGAQGMSAEAIGSAVRRALELCDGPVGVNVQVPPTTRRNPDDASVHAVLAPFRGELGLPSEPAAPPPTADPLALIEAALEAGAGVVSAALGDPAPLQPLARRAGVPLLAMVTTVEEARRSVEAGADVVIAQGAEAGGHRSSFELPERGLPPLIGSFALVPLVADAVDVPVVATGGIMDGRGVAAALALGAHGASLGTRFLLAAESGAPGHYRQRLLQLRPEDTVVSDRVSGRPARWIRNRLVDALDAGPEPLGWPAQYGAIADVRAKATREPHPDLMPMLAGQGASLAGAVQPAEAIVERVVAQAAAILGR
jgi:nitronate monooxygenase